MSAWAMKRKVLYFLTLVIIVLAIIAFFVWRIFFTRPETCFDRIQNQDEEGVDCGGVCDLFCSADVIDPIVRFARAVPVTDEVYHVIAQVENQNIASGIPQIPYTFKVYDEKNILIAEKSGVTFLGPNQETLIFLPHIKVGNRLPHFTNLEVRWSQVPWVDTDEEFSRVQIVVDGLVWERLDTNPKLTAQVQNTTFDPLYDIEFVVAVYDADGNIMAASNTYLQRLDQGQTKDIFFTWPVPFTAPPAQADVIPRINPFLEKNQP